MSNVVNLFSPERYCHDLTCRRVDCCFHCWGCGVDHSNAGDHPFCAPCKIEFNTDDDVDLTGFWDQSERPDSGTARRKRVDLKMSLDDLLRDVGQQWLKDQH